PTSQARGWLYVRVCHCPAEPGSRAALARLPRPVPSGRTAPSRRATCRPGLGARTHRPPRELGTERSGPRAAGAVTTPQGASGDVHGSSLRGQVGWPSTTMDVARIGRLFVLNGEV